MARSRLPFVTFKKFYDCLDEYKNVDGYTICTLAHAGLVAGVGLATNVPLALKLEEMGCIQIFSGYLVGAGKIEKNQTYLIKVIRPPVPDQYDGPK